MGNNNRWQDVSKVELIIMATSNDIIQVWGKVWGKVWGTAVLLVEVEVVGPVHCCN